MVVFTNLAGRLRCQTTGTKYLYARGTSTLILNFELEEKPELFVIPEFFVIKVVFCGIWTHKRNY